MKTSSPLSVLCFGGSLSEEEDKDKDKDKDKEEDKGHANTEKVPKFCSVGVVFEKGVVVNSRLCPSPIKYLNSSVVKPERSALSFRRRRRPRIRVVPRVENDVFVVSSEKKRMTTTTTTTTTVLDATREHSDFFDALVEVIPAKYYLHRRDETDDFETSQKPFGKKEHSTIQTTRKRKREKLDPNVTATTAEKQRKRMLLEKKTKGFEEETVVVGERRSTSPSPPEEGKSNMSDEKKKKEENEKAANVFKDMVIEAYTPTKEEKNERLEALRKRLEKKIQDSREKRKANEHEKKVKDAKNWREQREKMKLEKKEREKRMKKIVDAKKREAMRDNSNGKKTGDETDNEGDFPKMNLEFGNVDVDEVPTSRVNGKKRKETKKDLLSKALQREQDLADAGGDQTKEGKRVAEKHAWEASLKRARGEKVLDDPKLLRKSVKREEKKKQKSIEKWSERTKTVQDQQNAKKKKRKENIKAKADEKIEKNIERREKKRNRPGFEGRSKGMIN